MTDWNWNGSHWYKFDFHTHTPASSDYGKGLEQTTFKQRSPQEWLLDYMKAGVDCVAITDHNSGAWVDKLKDALTILEADQPNGYRSIHLFSGVELSVNGGLHLLAILGCDKTTSDIDSLLGAVGFSGTKGSSDTVTSKSFTEVVDVVVSAGGIAIPAHVDEDNGLFQLTGMTLQQALDCEDIFAMELVDASSEKPQVFEEKKWSWTEVLGSDGHHPSGDVGQRHPGSHFTWIKMGSPTLEGLRLALLDGALSVRRSDQQAEDPNEHAPQVLESIEISNARYLGRSRSFEIGFNPWLNAIIGGRGTGKSTIVEFLRIALRRQDELYDDLEKEFDKYLHVYTDRESGNLLTNDTKIVVIYRKNGSRFRVQWNPAGDLEPIEQEVNGGWRSAEGDIRQRFPVRIYSQKQIFQLANTPLALLGVVDEAPEVDRHSWLKRWNDEQGRFLSLRAKAREVEAGLADESRLRGELDDVKRKLTIFEQAGHADILKTFQNRSRQQREVEVWEEGWTGAGGQVRRLADEIVPDPLDAAPFDEQASTDIELRKHAAEVHERLDEIRKEMETLATQADEVVAQWRKSSEESSWKTSVDAAAQAYQALRDNLAREGAGDPAAYGEFVQRRQIIEQQLKELGERKIQVEDLNKQADMHLQKLMEVRRDLTESRLKFLNDILGENQYVRIQVVPYGARETAEERFRRLLQRESGFERDIGVPDGDGLLGELYGSTDSAHDVEQRLAKVKDKLRAIASDPYDAQAVADRRFATHISKLQPEVMDRVDLWFPEDSLDVQYSTSADGNNFRSIREGSPGQKTAALLAFLLSYGEEPLILDQPEDDLDNHLIYDLIVTQLREVKLRRQVIVVTHNANIVVNGDAELVLALAARGGETQKDCDGNLQEKRVREEICTVMEGGRKAFEQRYRRIALEGRRV